MTRSAGGGNEPASRVEHRFAGEVISALSRDLLFKDPSAGGVFTRSILLEASVDAITVSVSEDDRNRLLVITFDLTDRRKPGRKGRDSWAMGLPLSPAMQEEGKGESWAATIQVELMENLCSRQNSPTEWDDSEGGA